jgi:lysophospholipase L1-like esterase
MDDLTVLGALVAVAFTGAQSHDRSSAEDRDTVAVLGDSITYLSAAAIHAELDPDHTVEVNGVPGIDVAGQQTAALQFARTQPDVAIINLGTNDVGARRDPSEVIGELRAMASEFGPGACLVLVTLTTHVPSDDFAQRAGVVNRWIRSQEHVADWDAALAASSPSARLTSDTVHPTVEGQALMAQLLRQQVDACSI